MTTDDDIYNLDALRQETAPTADEELPGLEGARAAEFLATIDELHGWDPAEVSQAAAVERMRTERKRIELLADPAMTERVLGAGWQNRVAL